MPRSPTQRCASAYCPILTLTGDPDPTLVQNKKKNRLRRHELCLVIIVFCRENFQNGRIVHENVLSKFQSFDPQLFYM